MHEHSVGEQFCQTYYNTYDNNRQALGAFYRDTSMMTFENEQFLGAQSIVAKLSSLPFQKVRHQIVHVDCQRSAANNGVVIMVAGLLHVEGHASPFNYVQVFLLVQEPSGQYFCQNDMFRVGSG